MFLIHNNSYIVGFYYYKLCFCRSWTSENYVTV